jgi:hypothetical protein
LTAECPYKGLLPASKIDDTLNLLSDAEWFSIFDLKGGYLQIAPHPSDKEKTAFFSDLGCDTSELLWQHLSACWNPSCGGPYLQSLPGLPG